MSRRIRLASLLLATTLALGGLPLGLFGCKSPPPREHLMPAAGQGSDAACTHPFEPRVIRRAAPTEAQQHWTLRTSGKRNAIYASYLAAISESRRSVWITQAYFAPNQELRDVLEGAARRGVDVRLLVPGSSDIPFLLHASRHAYADLLEAGVRIFEYEGPVLHAKTAVVDGVWSTVGSSNLDYLSFIHNDEANATIVGHAFAREMEQMFEADLASAREVTPGAWRDRAVSDRVIQAFASAVKFWI